MRTQHLTKLWLAPALGVLAAGCSDLLEETPRGIVTPVNFYQTEADALAATNAAYDVFHNNDYIQGRDYVFMVETPTHQITSYSGTTNVRGQFDVHQISPSNGYILDSWEEAYRGINDANAVIDFVPEIDMNPTLRARLVGEARWLRALHYFNLVRLHGGVPLKTTSTQGLKDVVTAPSTADEIYDFLVKELTEIQKDLPLQSQYSASDWGRVSKGAAQHLLAQVLAQRGIAGRPENRAFDDPLLWPTAKSGDLAAAEAELRKIINSGVYCLTDNYGEMWEHDTGGENSCEIIFSVQNLNMGGQNMHVGNYLAPRQSGWNSNRTWTSAGVELPFFQSYHDDDVRRDVTWLVEYTTQQGQYRNWFQGAEKGLLQKWRWESPSLAKYLAQDATLLQNSTDLIVLRYGEVLADMAEVLFWQGKPAEALTYVNMLRQRAGVPPLSSLDKEALWWERNWELGSEQQAWYDGQKYWDLTAREIVQNSAQQHLIRKQIPRFELSRDRLVRLMPIPSEVLDRNPEMKQIPGMDAGGIGGH